MSYVAIATKICPICGIEHSNNTEVLLNRYLKDIPEDNCCTGFGLCEEHQKLFDDGYIGLIVADNTVDKDTLTLDEVSRTGDICHVKRHVFNSLFDLDIDETLPFVFIEPDVFNYIKSLQE